MSKNYKFVDSSREVVFIIENDGRIYRSLIITGIDPANTDYQAYLKWLEEGNTPEPAEE